MTARRLLIWGYRAPDRHILGLQHLQGARVLWGKQTLILVRRSRSVSRRADREFDLSTQCRTGGTLVMMLTLTVDGDGVDDFAVFVFSTGEALVYQGDDPSNALRWSSSGRFQIGEPLGIRAHCKVGGTEIILTKDGWLDISTALSGGRLSEASTYSDKIIQAAKSAANQYAVFSAGNACTTRQEICSLRTSLDPRSRQSRIWRYDGRLNPNSTHETRPQGHGASSMGGSNNLRSMEGCSLLRVRRLRVHR